ncbi:hypothetical protein PCASD_18670 [Puccinia coronata f. sp. avenae]|uniref:Uncharacterized protein n=2 Tax=Puccinia coronata f. sp. avenae TaxID=200324 RepID=A0A2N5SWV4_9BASI|nr:hypothetical protein PCASD_18670 [Puccinia coronata f. sp. avenae]
MMLLRAPQRDRHLPLPFFYPCSQARLATLSLFTQSLFLLFSAIYVCKEAVEHMLMSHPHGSEGTGGSHLGHSDRHQSEMEVSCSWVGSTLALVLFSALVTRNHRSLAQISACLEGRPAHAPVAVLNPCSTLTLGFGILIMGAACFISPSEIWPRLASQVSLILPLEFHQSLLCSSS